MKINTNGWVYRNLYQHYDDPKTACQYYWHVSMAVLAYTVFAAILIGLLVGTGNIVGATAAAIISLHYTSDLIAVHTILALLTMFVCWEWKPFKQGRSHVLAVYKKLTRHICIPIELIRE